MFQATRRRLAIWYTAVTAVLLLLFATGFYIYVRSTLIERIDDTLNHVVEVVERSLVIEPVENPPSSPAVLNGQFQVNVLASFHDNNYVLEDDHIDLEWFSPTGKLIWSTLAEPLNIRLNFNLNGETVAQKTKDSSYILRQVTDRVEIGRQVLGYLRVSHPWFEVTKPIRQLMLDLGIGTILTVISVGAIGWLLSGLAIAPVRESYQHLKQFTADASHELRNPIATIQTNVQVALSEPDIDPQQQQQLQLIERLTRRLGKLVDDLLFLARQDSGIVPQLVEIPLDALLIEVIEEQQVIATAADIKLSLEIVDSVVAENGFTVCGDWEQLARLFTNLISNALHYTPAGGKVDIELQFVVKGKKSSSLLGGDIQVKIKDNGIGISPEAIPHLFDRFYRVDPARTHHTVAGSGLGLAIAQTIVENHYGGIHIESQLNQGTMVTVTLPAHKSTEFGNW
ncbi:two-component sensor histidine kinase [Oscillatoriales cyanobacterium USR001]|nr:two-component sensor histidine kinase [Oscillatoriales cyanobacterium USR001]